MKNAVKGHTGFNYAPRTVGASVGDYGARNKVVARLDTSKQKFEEPWWGLNDSIHDTADLRTPCRRKLTYFLHAARCSRFRRFLG